MAADSAIAEVIDVTKRFRDVVALSRVNLTFRSGVTGLLGPNGAGKTTLMRCVSTLLRADEGSVTAFGVDVRDSESRSLIRRRIGFMPQEFGFYEGFTVYAFLDYAALMKRIDCRDERRREIDRVLDATSLGDRSDQKTKHLSGGMRRRLGLAVAMLGDPQLLILDEPTAGLDPEQRFRFRELISGLGSNRALVLSTHLSEDVAALAGRTVVLHEGQVLFHGATDDLARIAEGRVWITDDKPDGALVSWRQPNGTYRSLGLTAGGHPAQSTVEDGYLLLVGREKAART